ncbi:MAG: ABC transporter permease [Candidatus Cyclonatronum sp.]|uniref:ABC transporter permease n=1 Tax=Cyclonatronum sp. TaxID=3024185 RepID=UPI0025BB3A84|nr:ABC transporter permease [Cyclonatronum sp.]MCH8487344.1 ABC transporter permease [Cyclonatronum sp.]
MQLTEVFKQAIDSIRASKLRSGLTLLAISVGVFAIISANTAVLVLDTYFRDTLSLMGGDVITVSKTPAINVGQTDWSTFRNRQDITISQMERLQEMMPQSAEMNPSRSYRTTNVVFSDRETDPNINIRGANEFYLANNAYSISEGRNFTPEDMEYLRNVTVLGSEVAEILFPVEEPIGKTVRIEGRPYTVIGVTEERGTVFGSSLDRFALIPYTVAANKYGRNQNISIQLRAGSIEEVQATIDRVTGLLRLIRQVDPANPDDFEIATNQSISGALSQFTGFLYIIGFVIGGIVLLGAGIGVMNIMLVSVTERTREIGVRKAVGARKREITTQFLLESIALCQIGGLIGIIAGVALGNGAALYFGSSMVFPWGSAIGGVIGMTLIGVVFGVYPAMKAAKLDPIESLRYE